MSQGRAGRPRSLFRPGDVLRVFCPLREAEVSDADEFRVCVHWPWRWLHDAQSHRDQASGFDNSEWRGQLCFERDRDHPDAGWLFRFNPGLPVLQTGDHCRVGIPPMIVHVLEVFSWWLAHKWSTDPPASLAVHVLPQGAPHDVGRDDLLDSLRPYEREPIRGELLFRPYPHLRDLDVVADRHGRRWAFCAPWWWVELDHDADEGLPAPLAGPAWPPGQAPQGRQAVGLPQRRTARGHDHQVQSEDGKACYAKRKQTVEPVFGQVKDVRGARRFQRRGLRACAAEWKLLCGTHNLLKLWRHQAAALATPATA